MPLGRKHLRRSRDAPNVGWTIQRTASNLSGTRREVNVPKELDAAEGAKNQGFATNPLFAHFNSHFAMPFRIVL